MSVSGRQREASAGLAGPATASARRRAERAVLVALAVAVLFFCYLRQSSSVPVSSDGSGNILQAWDMLHGNLLLRHWYSSDVSFYTTELPQYALIEALLAHWLALGAWVVHVGAAMTYTLLVLLAALLAKGRAQGGAGLARALLAAGIMMAPQVSATSIVLLSPDHTGTAVPVLVAWLLIDRYPHARPRWLVPAAVGAILAWTMVADSVVLLTCIAPLVLVVVVRSFANLIRGGGDRACEVVRAIPGRSRRDRGRTRHPGAPGDQGPRRVPRVAHRDQVGAGRQLAARGSGHGQGLPRVVRR